MQVCGTSAWLCGALLVASAAPADAPEQLVTASLHAGTARVEAGQPFDVALRLRMAPGWHVYWENPGDSGQPPEVQWRLPEGYSAAPLRFPIPRTFDDAGGLIAYGYDTEVVLLATITPPSDAAAVAPTVTIAADVTWLVCEKVCLPGEAALVLTLPQDAAPAAEDTAMIDAWAERLPTPAAGVQLHKMAGAGVLDLRLDVPLPRGATRLEWFPPVLETAELVSKRVEQSGDVAHVDFTLRPMGIVGWGGGVFRSVLAYTDEAGRRRGLVVPFDLPRASEESR